MIGTAINLLGGKWNNATNKTGVQFEAGTAAMQGCPRSRPR